MAAEFHRAQSYPVRRRLEPLAGTSNSSDDSSAAQVTDSTGGTPG
jgi:hypothetical protein